MLLSRLPTFKTDEPVKEQKDSNNYMYKLQKQKAPAPQRFNSAETPKKARKEKKKNNQKNKNDCQAQENFILAIWVNTKIFELVTQEEKIDKTKLR